MNIQKFLSKKIKLSLINNNASLNCDPFIIRSTKKYNGDYQVNGIMKIAKTINIEPLMLAEKVISNIDLNNVAKKIEIIPPGFINIHLHQEWIEQLIEKINTCSRLGIHKFIKRKKIVIDYSSPNIAKEMHVGHLRSTILGDSMVRIMEFYGHKIIRANHIGDWGTQFGILLAYLDYINKDNIKININLKKLEKYYQISKKMYSENKLFAILSKKYVVKLQNKEKKTYDLWKKIIKITILENNKIYKMLNTTLRNQDIKGESSYHHMIHNIIIDLKKKNIAIKKNGSLVVLMDHVKNKNNDTMGVVIQKKDGAILYASTDIACLKYRCNELQVDKIIYYIDNRQKEYLQNICKIVKRAGYTSEKVQIQHHNFGMILSKNNKPFQTRSGNTIKLFDLLTESINRTTKIIKEKNPVLSEEQIINIANKIGIGSIKYADLSKNRVQNYIFDWNQMLTLEGNTVLYIQYTYTRILSIFRKGKESIFKLPSGIKLTKKIEIKLGIKILQFEEILLQTSETGQPHLICKYLYELSVIYSKFYDTCDILSSKNITLLSRLKLSSLTCRTIKKGLYMLGIKVIPYL
ncbi:Arginine--tRNA ligase [Buchnera aphidicola (Eriosoma lanigerum)]|uniref:arginine--tRNA ligase n=1 Tax=Buchnera aphidicola TaxID=9 RepID=UPI003464CC78